jgi:hypothetical protein
MKYFKHRLTNATIEGINSQIETLWKAACGFGNKKRFRTIIPFHSGAASVSTMLPPEIPEKRLSDREPV